MRNLIKWLKILIGLGFVGVVFYLILSFWSLDFFVDRWWFDSLGYEGYFLQRFSYKYITFMGVTLLFFSIFFFNFWVASRFLGNTASSDPGQKSYRKLLRMVQSGSMKIYLPLSLILAVPIALPFFQQWEKGLLFIFGQASGMEDPVFGHDISFYLFSFPFFRLIQNKLLSVFLLLLAGIIFLYWIEKRILAGKKQEFPAGAKTHVMLLVILTMAIQVWGFVLQCYSLLYNKTHLPLFFGPGFTEMRVILPLIVATIIFFIGTAISLVFYILKGKGIKKVLIFGILFILSMLGYNSNFIPGLIQKNLVEANAVAYEKPYIASNIKATLDAYGLAGITKLNYKLEQTSRITENPDVHESLRNIPVWDSTLLDDVYRQLQGIKPYYTFHEVDVGRYFVSGRYQQVYLSPRELDLGNLPESAKTWQSRHLQYTHGYGIVMTPAAQGGDESMTWFIRDMPVKSEYNLHVKNPGIYYGLGHYDYAIVPNEVGEVDHPKDETHELANYSGKGGIPLSSFVRKLLFAVYFKDRNIFFTSKTMENSRMLFRRNIRESIKRITPFFLLDSDPYIVTTAKGLFWIQDAYTFSDQYPNAQPYNSRFNYIRNSVKIVADAYNGTIDYYITSSPDSIIRTYQKIYPGLLKPIEKMDPELKQHLRYPKDLFEYQLTMYADYHQTDPEMFYLHEDAWEMPKLKLENQSIPMKPYYLTLNLFDSTKQEFLLLSPLSPIGRNNLGALAIAGCDGDNYGKIFVYSFPKGIQVYGPSQINTLIDQDTDIAQQLTLWDQAGSEVIRGRMIILPVGNMILYIQPVYLSSSTRLKIPELKRMIVSQGEVVAMAASLEEAIKELEIKLEKRIERQRSRFPTSSEVVVPPEKVDSKPGGNQIFKQEAEKRIPDITSEEALEKEEKEVEVAPDPEDSVSRIPDAAEDPVITPEETEEPNQEAESLESL
ncbi:MAG: UPF0182 family protein [Desulfobacterales bacterium]